MTQTFSMEPEETSGADIQLDLMTGKYASLVHLVNGRSMLWAVKIRSSCDLHQVQLSITYAPGYAEPQQYSIAHIAAGEEYSLSVACPAFDARALLSIEDDEPGTVTAELWAEDGALLASRTDDFHWLAYNTWIGGTDFPELLAALVLPHDPVVDDIICELSDGREANSPWPGYDEEPEAVRECIRRLWDTLLRHSIDYRLPPGEGMRDIGVGQRVRTPSIIREKGYSTCLDTTLLLAACLTRLRLNPVVLLISGHSFLGVFLQKTALPSPHGTPLPTVRNLVEEGKLLAIETTCLNQGTDFDDATLFGFICMDKLSADAEFTALDIEQIWHELGIHPIMGDCPAVNTTGATYSDTCDTLVSSAPRSRMESWQRRLLDLSRRNNLLNTCDDGRCQIPLNVPRVAELEDELADNTTFRIKTLPETYWTGTTQARSEETSFLHARRADEAAASMFHKHELLADMPAETLQSALHSLYSASRREMEESGVNTLHIACGFLRWVPKGEPAEQAMRAPLLLIPVRLRRTTVREGFTLSGMEDGAHINRTLLELLKEEFSLCIPELEGPLPTDNSGLDVPLIFDIMRGAISGIPGWEVQETCLLASFSFSKYLMWRDLVDHQEHFLRHPILAHLAADDRGTFPEQEGFPDTRRLDHEVDAHEIYTPLPADSSQLAAILAAARGKSFVLEGPPGTGKSQTIANMIAHCLGHGKTVLFVAEKTAALDVVFKRLARIGLGEYCLELHSNKALPSAVMNQFSEAVERLQVGLAPDEWDESVDTMTALRHRLNSLPREMHRRYPDGSCLYEDICTTISHSTLPDVPLPESDTPLVCTRSRKRELLERAEDLAAHYTLIATQARAYARSLTRTDHTPAWEQKLAEALARCTDTLAQLCSVRAHVAEALELPAAEVAAHLGLFSLAMELASAAGWHMLLPSSAEETLQTLQKALMHAAEYRRLAQFLSLPYPTDLLQHPQLDYWQQESEEAHASFWPFSWWKMRRVKRFLQRQARIHSEPNALRDLPTLLAMRAETRILGKLAEALPASLRKGVNTEQSDRREAMLIAEKLAAACGDTGEPFARRLHERLSRHETEPDLARQIATFRTLSAELAQVAEQISTLLGASCRERLKAASEEALSWAQGLLAVRDQWRAITLWNKSIAAADKAGCAIFAEALLSGQTEPHRLADAVAVSFSRAKLNAAAESIDALHDFAPLIHEKHIRDFAAQTTHLRERTCAHIRNILALRAAGILRYDDERTLLRREIAKKRRHIPLRKLLAATPHASTLLKPCFLMSPLSVAQYLSPEASPFDVVIFDEASQVPVWDAVGAIGRGSSVIICGDSHQLPPTSFFSRSRADDGNDPETEPNLENILDESLAAGIPRLKLTWHYRSMAESLISFSNDRYYRGKMTTFPTPAIRDNALQLHYIGGAYEPGAAGRVNMSEARAVVDHVLATLRQPHFRYTAATSIGIVTFNAPQQKLITELLEEACAEDPSLEPYFAEENPECIFVKNLENVQGDERGVIYFSTTYGPDAEGRLSLNLGPLNLSGGERRLNVAISRARSAMHVFTSLRPEDLSRARSRGVADLRAFLEYAEQVCRLSAAGVSMGPQDALVRHIAHRLEALGWRCRTHVGASDYRVDIVVEQPGEEGVALAGILLDGPAYATAHTAIDRDVVRPEAMRQLGWNLLTLWSIDWWRNPEISLATLHAELGKLATAAPAAESALPTLAQPAPRRRVTAPLPPPAPERPAIPPGPSIDTYEPKEQLPALFEMSDRSLTGLIFNILEQEAPMSMELLFSRLTHMAPIPFSPQTRAFRDAQFRIVNKLRSTLEALAEAQALDLHEEEAPDSEVTDLIISLPGSAPVQPRACGYRPPELIPLSELHAISRHVQKALHCPHGSDAHLRGMCDFLAIPRLTTRLKAFLLQAIGKPAPDLPA